MAATQTRQVVSWMILFTGANFGVKGLYALTVLLIASILTPEAYASFGILYALQGAMTAFAIVGLQELTAARLKKYSFGRRRQVLFMRISGLFGMTALLGLILLFPLVSLMLHADSLLITTASAIMMGAVIGYGVLQANFHRIAHNNVASLLSSAGIPLFGVIGLMIGVWWSRDLILIFTLGFAGASIALTILIISGYALLGPLPPLKLARSELIILGPFVLMCIFGWLSGYGMNFIIDLHFDPLHVATFTFLFTISSVSQMIASSLNMVWAPHFYQMFNDGAMDQAESRNRFFFTLLATVLGIIGLLFVAALPWISNLVGGNLVRYGAFRLELALLMAGYIVCISWWYGQNYYHVAGYGPALMRLSLWSGGSGLVLWVVCMAILGPTGIFLGFFLQMTIKAGAMWVAGNSHWHLRPPWLAMIIGCALTFCGLLFPLPY
jgi:O-antigen/teichoic acid export membrane protein